MKWWMEYALFAGYTLGTIGGVVMMKYAIPGLRAGFIGAGWEAASIWTALTGGTLYVSGAVFWLFLLARNELSTVYPIAVGVTILASTAVAIGVFGESVSGLKLLGCMLLIIGAALVAQG